jgi:NADP-dependent 3-hydroxy acid dehydrogenase YdfG
MSMSVFVTGASAGFGAAVARKFVSEGHRKKVADFSSTIPGWFWFDRLQPSH